MNISRSVSATVRIVLLLLMLVTQSSLVLAQDGPALPSTWQADYETYVVVSGDFGGGGGWEVIQPVVKAGASGLPGTPDAPASADCTSIGNILAPTFLYPTAGNIGTISPRYSWSVQGSMNVEGMQFWFEVSTSENFSDIYFRFHGSAVSGNFRFPWNHTANQRYYLRAHLFCDYDDRQGASTPTLSFTTGANGTLLPPPGMKMPADGAQVHQDQVRFSWNGVGGVQEYLLLYQPIGSSSYYFRWLTVTQVDVGAVNFTVGENYQWWLATATTYGIGAESSYRTFTIIIPEYQANPDGFAVNNRARSKPAWDVFKETFSNMNVENNTAIRSFYDGPYASTFSAWMCDGLSTTSLAYYENIIERPNSKSVTYALGNDVDWRMIDILHGRQRSKAVTDHRRTLWPTNPGVGAVYDQIRTHLPHQTNDPYVLSFFPAPNSSNQIAHTVVPYRVDDQGNGVVYIYVYDPNHPGNNNRRVSLNLQNNPATFEYQTDIGNLPTFRSNNGYMLVYTPLSKYLEFDGRVLAQENYVTAGMGCNITEPSCELDIEDAQGNHIGNLTGSLVATIPGAVPYFDLLRSDPVTQGIEFALPLGSYQVAFAANQFDFYYSTSDVTVRIQNSGSTGLNTTSAAPSGSGSLLVGENQFSYSYQNPTGQEFAVQYALEQDPDSRVWVLEHLTAVGPSSINLQSTGKNLLVNSQGIQANIDLTIGGDDGSFVYNSFPLPPDATLSIEAPELYPASFVTVTVTTPANPDGQVYVLENQVLTYYLPLAMR